MLIYQLCTGVVQSRVSFQQRQQVRLRGGEGEERGRRGGMGRRGSGEGEESEYIANITLGVFIYSRQPLFN